MPPPLPPPAIADPPAPTAPPAAATPPARGRSALRRWGRRLVRIAAAVYLALLLMAFFFQNWLIFPGTATQGTAAARLRAAPGEEVLALTAADGQHVAALYGPAVDAAGRPRPDADRRPTILYFYGNGMCAADAWDEFARFRRAGANVLVVDYLGFGMSEGTASEANCYATADAAYDYLTQQRHVPAHLIVPVGRSLGGATAIDLAARRPVGGLATFSAFTSMKAMARRTLPFLPTSLILRHHFDNEGKLPGVHAPYFLAHGTADRVVPFDMAGRLAAAAGGPVTRFDAPGGDHNDLFEVGGDAMMAPFKAFLDRVAGQ